MNTGRRFQRKGRLHSFACRLSHSSSIIGIVWLVSLALVLSNCSSTNRLLTEQSIHVYRDELLLKGLMRFVEARGDLVAYPPSTLPGGNGRADYGGLYFRSIEDSATFTRLVRPDDYLLFHHERNHELHYMESKEFNDDLHHSHPSSYDHYEEQDFSRMRCMRPKWSYDYFPTCNTFHELHPFRPESRLEHTFAYLLLSNGYYRNSWLLQQEKERVVWKQLRFNDRRTYGALTMSLIQAEAMSMAATSSSRRTIDIYGHCGTSVLVEEAGIIPATAYSANNFAWIHQKALDEVQKDDVQPQNDLSPEEKLKIALNMAESLADLHGHERGVLVNDDVQFEQFLLGREGHLKLADFNNGRALAFNMERKRYCSFQTNFHHLYRSPEEVGGGPTDETSDVYALGSYYYTLVTGLQVYYHIGSARRALQAVTRGHKPYIDDRYRHRSLIEGRLVEIMEQMYEYETFHRPSIFQVVKHLRETVRLYEEQNPDQPRIASVPLDRLALS